LAWGLLLACRRVSIRWPIPTATYHPVQSASRVDLPPTALQQHEPAKESAAPLRLEDVFWVPRNGTLAAGAASVHCRTRRCLARSVLRIAEPRPKRRGDQQASTWTDGGPATVGSSDADLGARQPCRLPDCGARETMQLGQHVPIVCSAAARLMARDDKTCCVALQPTRVA
jgi:hypothetical protein